MTQSIPNRKKRAGSPVKWLTRTIFVVSLMATGACKDFVEIAPPADQIIPSTVFSDDRTAISSITGLYSQMMAGNLFFMNGAMSLYPALSSDELYNTSPNTGIDAFTANVIPADSRLVQNSIWRYAYNYIYHANACLEGLSGAEGIRDPVRQQLTGEALFIRALCHFYLVNLFGDIPLAVTTDYRVNQAMARTPEEQVYEQIISDLREAQSLLVSQYPTGSPVRPNLWAATALLARVYLYREDWEKAEAEAGKVIGSGDYRLLDDPKQVFLAGSLEAIWQLLPVSNSFNTAEGASFIPSSQTVTPPYALTLYLLTAFEDNDRRKTSWLGLATIEGQEYYYPYKYQVRSGSEKTEYNTVLRLAEQYLIRAEARAQLNNSEGAAADLNLVRQRAGLEPVASQDRKAILRAVQQERQVELFAEWGHRWFDLKRTGRADDVLSTVKPGWTPGSALYPIPFLEIERNPALTQNEGY